MKSICLLLGLLLGLKLAARAQPTAADKNALYAYEGTYELNPGHRITLGIFDEFKSLVYLDLKTRQLGALKPIKPDVFSDNNDSTKYFTFRRDSKGGISGVTITANKLAVIGKRVAPHVRQAVAFTSGPHTLKGDLYLPATKGPHPAVVFAHGSGPSTRSVAFFTTYFLQLGIAVLSFDKQGAGESAGDWQTASFDELANDVLAGISYLKTTKSIDQQRIGIMGNSQGGWIGAMAAARSKDVAFLVVRVGSGENVLQTMLHENRGINLADGFKEKDVQQMLEMDTRYMTAARQQKTWEQGDSILSSYKSATWFKEIYPKPRVKSAASAKNWQWMQKNLAYDSYEYLQQVKAPVLWLLAEKDWNVNSQQSYPRIMEALQKAQNKNHVVKIIPDSGHNGLVVKTGYYNEPFSWQYAPGFWDTVGSWLRQNRLVP